MLAHRLKVHLISATTDFLHALVPHLLEEPDVSKRQTELAQTLKVGGKESLQPFLDKFRRFKTERMWQVI